MVYMFVCVHTWPLTGENERNWAYAVNNNYPTDETLNATERCTI